jgi:hypothetical protein
MDLRGRRVQFAIQDIYYPSPEAALAELHGADLLSGVVMDVSDTGSELSAFVVVKVEKLVPPVVIAVERIREVE